ncbi:MAG: nucleotidyltransferase domain-containing protein [Sodaliphilus sp.]|jgi:predicted nucleotidyltransferase|nr:nucleotidyltransferase domain-containing protein [Muribaculaceae bacterium]MCI6078937.1 nucleotidyltransferase domain-containing protein [Bacteroidales bacterium]MDY2593146.1 nucleotidyltransferase domain-containing protein [Sodaliphilus sp.]HAO64310.1 nucleotidyltransferase [Porphyromonadaceae bacterium]MCI6335674.1 nucleotidyltransferase domain-containing protein [Bacteroidales bacterium]
MDKNIIDIICQYFSRKPIEKAWVFGSFSRGEQRPDSDIDILITFVPNTKMGLQFFGMIDDLEKLLNRSVDLVVEGDLLPFAAKSANRDKKLIYERNC